MRLLAQVLVVSVVARTSLAGPACARRMRNTEDCIAACASRWGWPGSAMGADPWGAVMVPSGKGKSGVEYACGETTSSSAVVSTTLSTIAPAPTLVQNPVPEPSSVTTLTLTSTTSTTSETPTTTEEPTTSSTEVLSTKDTPEETFRGLNVDPEPSSQAPPPPPPPPTTSSAQPEPSTPLPPPPAPSPSTTELPPAPPPSPSPSPSPSPAPAPVSNTPAANNAGSSDIDAYLAGHNTVRARHGAAPLTWSNELAAKAQQWANGCVFEHSGGVLGRFGENLAAGTGANYNIAQAIKSWTDEVSEYNPSNPIASHFTQVVWKSTTQVGCAVQLCNGIFSANFGIAKYFVCEYSAPGNVIGQFAQNVQV